MPAAAVLVEGLGRLLALLDVLENYPGAEVAAPRRAPPTKRRRRPSSPATCRRPALKRARTRQPRVANAGAGEQ
ncbi:hypothetical protein ACU4GD_04365 [Cupriavidus basilensis]